MRRVGCWVVHLYSFTTSLTLKITFSAPNPPVLHVDSPFFLDRPNNSAHHISHIGAVPPPPEPRLSRPAFHSPVTPKHSPTLRLDPP